MNDRITEQFVMSKRHVPHFPIDVNEIVECMTNKGIKQKKS